jgi:metal-sulfur cluster biosynthetic enzyme
MEDAADKKSLRWQAETDYPELCAKLREKLSEVVDPEIGLNIIQLGLIREVTIEPESATIRMILTTPFCPYAGNMLEMTREKAEEALERPATIDLGLEPWDFSMMDEDVSNEWGLFYP